MANITRVTSLGPQDLAFVTAVSRGIDPAIAAQECGLVTQGQNPGTKARNTLRRADIQLALHIEIARLLHSDAIVARAVARKFLEDESLNAKIRADLAIKILDRAGFGAPKAADAPSTTEKSLSEMSVIELRQQAERLEGELAARAKPIRANDAPAEAEKPGESMED